MYSYEYDAETGGILLNTTPLVFSKEPRPVYYKELDILGFGKYWKYDKDDAFPYMWAEANCYYYRGRLVAKTKGGSLYTAPELIMLEEPEPGGKLRPVDIVTMVAKNREMIDIIEQSTVKKIFDVYKRYKYRLDVFHVAFSGGKDSIVLLDLVKKTLPKNNFVVIFGDTGMEFPDTYDAIDKVEAQCKEEGIDFHRVKSHLDAKESWEIFGPPSRVLRWCCSVHKSTPQTLKLRDLLGKNDYVGLDYVGVRSHESLKRSKYEYENYSKKQKGQYSHNSILEWTSAEVWLYVYANGLIINEAYKKGNARAGCLFCPMSGGKSDFIRYQSYQDEINEFIDIIKRSNGRDEGKEAALETYITNGGWRTRRNGRDLRNNPIRCIERNENGFLVIDIIQPKTDWQEWIKTLGDVSGSNGNYHIIFERKHIAFSLIATKNRYTASISEQVLRENPTFGKMFRQVFRKAAYCVGCRVCETNCRNGCISFNDGLSISCIHCRSRDCHAIDDGCLAFHSLRLPKGDGKTMKSINSFADHAPKPEWLRSFFDLKNNFLTEHTLGPMMISMFKRFLRDAGLLENGQFSTTAQIVDGIGWESESAQGIILSNLAYNPQFEWYIKNLEIDREYPRRSVENMLVAVDVSEKDAKSIVKAFKRITETPIGTVLGFGHVTNKGRSVDTLRRSACSVSDPRVILYSLYKFAEACGGYYQFTLTRLLNYTIDSDGISPTQIFGLDRETMEPILIGLSANYPDFISATFTHDLDKISLKDDKTPGDVLELFLA